MFTNQNLKVGQILEVTFNNDIDYVNCTVTWEIVRVEEKRFYYRKTDGSEAIIGRAYSLLNRKSVKINLPVS